jgi:hypothetical protein
MGDNIKMNIQEVGLGAWTGQVAGTCKCDNESSGSVKCGEFLDWLRTC